MDDLIGIVVALLIWGGSALVARAGKVARKTQQAQPVGPSASQQHDVTDPGDSRDSEGWDDDEEAYEDPDDGASRGETLQEVLRRRMQEAMGDVGEVYRPSTHEAHEQPPQSISLPRGGFVDELGSIIDDLDEEPVAQADIPFYVFQGYDAVRQHTAAASGDTAKTFHDARRPQETISDGILIHDADVAGGFDLRQAIVYDTILRNENTEYLSNR